MPPPAYFLGYIVNRMWPTMWSTQMRRLMRWCFSPNRHSQVFLWYGTPKIRSQVSVWIPLIRMWPQMSACVCLCELSVCVCVSACVWRECIGKGGGGLQVNVISYSIWMSTNKLWLWLMRIGPDHTENHTSNRKHFLLLSIHEEQTCICVLL